MERSLTLFGAYVYACPIMPMKEQYFIFRKREELLGIRLVTGYCYCNINSFSKPRSLSVTTWKR